MQRLNVHSKRYCTYGICCITGIYSEPADYVDDDGITDPDAASNREEDPVRWINADGSQPSYYNWRPTSVGSDSDYQTVGGSSSSRARCVAVTGNRLQYILKPCTSDSHRLPAVCSTPATAAAAASQPAPATSRSQPARRRLQSSSFRAGG